MEMENRQQETEITSAQRLAIAIAWRYNGLNTSRRDTQSPPVGLDKGEEFLAC